MTVVYNARKRGEDRASDYFKRTENVAGVKDMRFQALMPDILHWLGITKIDRMLSMSKYVPVPCSTTAPPRVTPPPSLSQIDHPAANNTVLQHETRRHRRPRVSNSGARRSMGRTQRGFPLPMLLGLTDLVFFPAPESPSTSVSSSPNL